MAYLATRWNPLKDVLLLGGIGNKERFDCISFYILINGKRWETIFVNFQCLFNGGDECDVYCTVVILCCFVLCSVLINV